MLNDNEGYIMKIRYLVIGLIAGTSHEIGWFNTLDDAIRAIKESSVNDGLVSYRIETFQYTSSLRCRIVDRQLFIE